MSAVWPALDLPCATLPGVGPSRQRQLDAAGLGTVERLLRHLPRRYLDQTVLTPLEHITAPGPYTLVADVERVHASRAGGRMVLRAVLGAGAGRLPAIWFNMRHLVRVVRPGARLLLTGVVVSAPGGRLLLRAPEVRPVAGAARAPGWVPVYRLPAGIPRHVLQRAIAAAAQGHAAEVPDPLPPGVGRPPGLLAAGEAWRELHIPSSAERLDAARRTVVLHELVALHAALRRRRARLRPPRVPIGVADGRLGLVRFFGALPFSATAAQRRVVAEIARDLAGPRAMYRLLQGEVGAGKTVVAAAAAAWVAAAGGQTLLLVPSTILAEQHAVTLRKLCGAPCVVELLTGATPGVARARILARLASGEPVLLVGTHALLAPAVSLPRLRLVIIDEQHRFGVGQRAQAVDGGADLLVMTATPIPRTLVQTLYGDMDISVLDELPPGRRPVRTFLRPPQARPAIYRFVGEQIRSGRQAFVVCPRIGTEGKDGEWEDAEPGVGNRASAEAWAQRLRRLLPPDSVGLVHGGLTAAERTATMTRFAAGELAVLVATTVVEVGVDVPNASVMVVEDAERFGLAQLHQLRGRVGRGPHPGYCILVAREHHARLEAMERLRDGFAVAQADLEERGPGEVLGTRQHGLPGLTLARMDRDHDLWRLAPSLAARILATDPELARPEHHALGRLVTRWEMDAGDPLADGSV